MIVLVYLVRNLQVAWYRKSLTAKIEAAIVVDKSNGEMFTAWRWLVYESVTHDEMVLKFWRRPSSFYRNSAFILPSKYFAPVPNN